MTGVQTCALPILDVEYLKEGDRNILRAYIDKTGGVTIEDCENASRAFDPLLDRENFITDVYTLEVSSPGLGRQIRRPHDFEYALGKSVDVHTYKAVSGKKEFSGILAAYDEKTVTIDMKETDKVKETKKPKGKQKAEEKDQPDEKEQNQLKKKEKIFNRTDISLIRLTYTF